MVKVHLYGELAEKFGSSFNFDIRTPAEALHALCANFPSFKMEFAKYDYEVKVGPDRQPVLIEEIVMRNCKGELHFMPVVAGAKSAGQQIATGILLIAVAFFAPYAFTNVAGMTTTALTAGGGVTFTAGTLMASVASAVTYVGWSMVIGGVAAKLIGEPPNPNLNEEDKTRTTHEFNGPVNTRAHGRPKPLGYGMLVIGSHELSRSVVNEDQL